MPLKNSGQKGGQKIGSIGNTYIDNQDNILNKSGQKEVVRNGGQNQGEGTRAKIVEAMRNKPEISRRELAELYPDMVFKTDIWVKLICKSRFLSVILQSKRLWKLK